MTKYDIGSFAKIYGYIFIYRHGPFDFLRKGWGNG